MIQNTPRVVMLRDLSIGTVFSYDGMTLRKTATCGPLDPIGRKFSVGGPLQGYACEPKFGGQFQTSEALQVWLPETAEVTVLP